MLPILTIIMIFGAGIVVGFFVSIGTNWNKQPKQETDLKGTLPQDPPMYIRHQHQLNQLRVEQIITFNDLRNTQIDVLRLTKDRMMQRLFEDIEPFVETHEEDHQYGKRVMFRIVVKKKIKRN